MLNSAPLPPTLVSAAALLALLAAPAVGATSQANLPVAPVTLLSPAAVMACIGNDCQTTPQVSTVGFVVTANVSTASLVGAVPPVLVPVACPNADDGAAQGSAVAVLTPEAGTLMLVVNVAGTLPSGIPYTATLGPSTLRVRAGSSTVVSTCASDDSGGGSAPAPQASRDASGSGSATSQASDTATAMSLEMPILPLRRGVAAPARSVARGARAHRVVKAPAKIRWAGRAAVHGLRPRHAPAR